MKMNILTNDIGWNFDNTYSRLPDILMTKQNPIPVKQPKLELLNLNLAKELNLNFDNQEKSYLSSLFSGNVLPSGSDCISQAYAGHQFGHFTMLGDGRAVLLGEHLNSTNKRFDIQFKGSGRTPYSRNGDGRAALGPMLREYIISEAMSGLNIPTTRSLAMVSTGEEILREERLQAAILTRVASSHIRVGTFQYLAKKDNLEILKNLVKYTFNRHYDYKTENSNIAVSLLKGLIDKQISLVLNWIRVGFIHGVLNTDNVSLSGETIDYGPCGFLEHYDPNTVFSSIDHQGRYSFKNQKIICHWNISRFAETLIPLLANDENEAIDIGTKIINEFNDKFKSQWIIMMKKKLGFTNYYPEDEKLINRILSWMEKNKSDYTNTFIYLMDNKFYRNNIYQNNSFLNLQKEWEGRIQKNKITETNYLDIMKKNNPLVIPRNHIVEEAINNVCKNNDYSKFDDLLKIISRPYDDIKNADYFQTPAPLNYTQNYKTYCGT